MTYTVEFDRSAEKEMLALPQLGATELGAP